MELANLLTAAIGIFSGVAMLGAVLSSVFGKSIEEDELMFRS